MSEIKPTTKEKMEIAVEALKVKMEFRTSFVECCKNCIHSRDQHGQFLCRLNCIHLLVSADDVCSYYDKKK